METQETQTRRLRLPITRDRRLELSSHLLLVLDQLDEKAAELAAVKEDAKEFADAKKSLVRQLRVDMKDGLEDQDVEVQLQVDFDSDELLFVGLSGRWAGEVLERRRLTAEERVRAAQGKLFPEARPRAPEIHVTVGEAPPEVARPPSPAKDDDRQDHDQIGLAKDDPERLRHVYVEGDLCSNCSHGWSSTKSPRKAKDGHARSSGKCYHVDQEADVVVACDCTAHMPIVHRVVVAGRKPEDDAAAGVEAPDEVRCYCGEILGLTGEGLEVLGRAFEGHVEKLKVKLEKATS